MTDASLIVCLCKYLNVLKKETQNTQSAYVSRMEGDVSRMEGDVSRMEGDVSRIEGDVSRMEGDVRFK